MVRACPEAPAIPFIRVPDATEGDIQKAMDLGALGIIVPLVSTVEEAERAVRYARYPPDGHRSQGGGQHRVLYGPDYRRTANQNLLIVVMIENLEGVEIVDEIAAVPGVDVVFAASGDLGSFSGYSRDDPRYEAMIDRIREAALAAGKKFIGTSIPGPRLWRASCGGSGRGLPPVLGGVGSPGSWGARRGTGRQPSDSLPADNSPFAPRSALHAGAEPSLRRCGPRRAGGAGEIERLCPVCGCDRVCA